MERIQNKRKINVQYAETLKNEAHNTHVGKNASNLDKQSKIEMS